MAENLLSAPTVAKAKPTDKPVKMSDGGGLLLEVRPNGAKWWRWRYTFAGKEKMLSLGVYPAVSLSDARERRNEARALLTAGTDPSESRKADKAAQAHAQVIATKVATGEPLPGTFEAVARAWLAVRRDEWAPSYFDKIEARLINDVFPHIGSTPAGDVTPPDLLALLRRIEARGAIESARRVRETCSLVFLRPGSELREAEWSEFDLDAGTWLVPAARMKRRKHGKENGADHLVPLSRQAVEILRELQPLTGRGLHVFPGVRHRDQPMSENTLNAALDALGRAYNRTEFLEQCRQMMQTWADYLDRLRIGAQVVQIRAA